MTLHRSIEARRALLLMLSAAVVVLVLAACGSSEEEAAPAAEPIETAEAAPAEFEAALRAVSDRAETSVTEALAPILDPVLQATTSTERPDRLPPGALEEALPAASAALDAYGAEIEALEAPEAFRADQARHVSGLREIAELFDEVAAADAARDQARVEALSRELGSVTRDLVGELSPEYAALAWVAPERAGADVFVGLSAEESDYLDGVAMAQEEFESRASRYRAAIGQVYTSQEALLNALYDAGAGQAVKAVQDVALTLEPPPRFEADHQLWLAVLEEQVRIDQVIGEAARDGDIVAFLVNDPRLLLAGATTAAAFTPEFAVTLGAPPRPELDLGSAIAGTSYGQELFEALLPLALQPPPEAYYDFHPTTADEAALEAIPLIAREVIAFLEERRATTAALSPPPEYTSDHERILQYLDELLDSHGAVSAAAESGEIATARDAIEATREPLCAAAAELSEDVKAAAPTFDLPRGACPS